MRKSGLLTLFILCACNIVFADTIKVTSIDALQSAINNAKAGDIIVLANGVYTTTEDVTVTRKGNKAHPIVICAETIGNAEIGGNGGFNLAGGAAYVTIKGFKFTHK